MAGNTASGYRQTSGGVQRSLVGVQKLFELLLPGEDAKRGAGESILLSESVFEKAQVGGSDVLRMADEQGEDGRLRGDLGDKRGLGDLGGFPFSNGQGVSRQNLLQELV